MAKSTIVKSNVQGSLAATDATPVTPLTYVCTFDMGDFTISGLVEGMREIVTHERKGNICGISYGARVYPTFSFTAKMAQFTDLTSGTLSDFLLRTTGSEYAAAVSTSGTGRPYTTDWAFQIEGLTVGDDADHNFTMEKVHCTADFSEGDSDTFSVSGTIYGDITGDIALSEHTN